MAAIGSRVRGKHEMSPMTDEQLLVRLADREDNYTERKPDGVKPEEIRQTVCAFSNSLTAGATAVLYIGIHDKTGAVLGVDNSDMVQKRVREAIDRCYPSITNYAMRVLDVGGKTVVAVKVGASDNRPHFTGPAFIRRGSESVTASEQIFQKMVASRNSKTARILRMRGGVISFQSIGHRIGDTKVITDKAYREGGECVVEDCDAHLVYLSLTSSGRRVTEPLEHVEIQYDGERNRDMLVIRY